MCMISFEHQRKIDIMLIITVYFFIIALKYETELLWFRAVFRVAFKWNF